MKKFISIIVLACMFTTLFSAVATAVELPLRVVVNGTQLTFPDAQPFVDSNGRTQTPARFIGEALGATVTWDDKGQKAEFVLGSKKLVLYIGNKEYDLDGQKQQMDTAALLQEGRTFVPARYVAEAFGATVTWDGDVRTVYITTGVDNTPKDGSIVLKNGYYIPNDTEVVIINSSDSSKFQTELAISMLYDNYDKQIKDLAYALSRKFGQKISDQIIIYIKQKESVGDHLEEKYIYVSDIKQYLWIRASYGSEISILVCVPGYNPQV